MGELSSLWGIEEDDDAVGMEQRLLDATLELERLRAESMEEAKKNREYVNRLIGMLNSALEERDAARSQLQKLIQIAGENLKQGNSSVTEDNSVSDSYKYHSHGSSPVESLFDPVDLSKGSTISIGHQIHSGDFDQGSLIIENMVEGKALPQRGKFLEAVLRAGPLLQTLVTAGPLPQWRNPPQIKAFHFPNLSVRVDAFGQRSLVSGQVNLSKYSYGSAQFQANSNVHSVGDIGCLNNSSSAMNGHTSLCKRRRFS